MACFYPHRVYRPVCQKTTSGSVYNKLKIAGSTGRTVAANAVPKAENIYTKAPPPPIEIGGFRREVR